MASKGGLSLFTPEKIQKSISNSQFNKSMQGNSKQKKTKKMSYMYIKTKEKKERKII